MKKHKSKCRITLLLLLSILPHISWATTMFPFNEVNKKWNISINGGYNHSAEVMVYGFGLTIKGFHVTIGGTGSTHEDDVRVGKWEEKSSVIIHAGYQIPITKAIRIIPVIGTSGAGEVLTNGYDYKISNNGTIHNKTHNDIKYKFDYGAHLVLNPYKKLIINLAGTKYTLYAGIGFEF